ncbi:unnamed protein product [Alternaria alternata]
MLVPSQPHACNICQSKLLFNNRDSWEEITEPWSTTGHDWGYWFDLWYGEAVELAQHGCELMEWLVTLRRPDTTADSQLRAYYTHVSEEQLALDWVEEISQYTDNKDFVTAELGLEYLWIDALCIIQDDDADKGVELARMGDIYSKAHFTLLASRSPTVQDGFLKPRYIPKERGYRLPYICNDGQIGSVVLWAGRDVGVAEPIHQRGWCFQEQILSPRILEFGTHQIRYLCTANRTEEVVPETDGWITNSETFAVHGTGRPLDLPANWATLPVDGTEFLTMWNNIVMHYSHLSLSFSTDRLRAISAIARKLKQASSARYYAGLWAEHLPSQLLWETANDDKLFPIAARAAEPAAPSWSWASMQGPISLRDYEGHAAYQTLDIFINNSTPGDDFSGIIDISNASISLRTLTLHARVTRHKNPSSPWWPTDLVDNSWSMTVQEDSEQFFPLLLFIDPESGKEWSDISGRWDEFTTGDHAVLLAKITLGKGLILKAKPSSMEKYTRVGTFQLDTYVEDDDRWQQRDISIH